MLYDPTDINKKGNYEEMKVEFIDTGVDGQIHVYVCEYTAPEDFETTDPPIDCTAPTSLNMRHQDITILQGLSTSVLDLDPNKQQEIIIFGTGPAAERSIRIKAYGPDGSDADSNPDIKGIPYFGETVVDINAGMGGVTRALRVTIPSSPGGSSSSPAPAPLFLVNSGGGAYGPDSSGNNWQIDGFYSGGSTYGVGTPISGTTDGTLYQTERYGDFTYTFTPSSSHTVTLKFAEIYFNGPGVRTFDVRINGTLVLDDYDIFVAAGGANTAHDRTFTTTANGSGNITIQFISVGNNSAVDAIQID
jgi:hypothetical protein